MLIASAFAMHIQAARHTCVAFVSSLHVHACQLQHSIIIIHSKSMLAASKKRHLCRRRIMPITMLSSMKHRSLPYGVFHATGCLKPHQRIQFDDRAFKRLISLVLCWEHDWSWWPPSSHVYLKPERVTSGEVTFFKGVLTVSANIGS